MTPEQVAELEALAEKATPGPWECFQDASYYDMWLVRQVHDRTFGHGFHLINGEEAAALRDLLNREVLKGDG